MEGFYIDPFTTQQNDCEMLGNKRPTRAPWKRKRSKVHCEFFTQVNCLVSSYNHHFTLSIEIEKYDKTCPQPSLESCLLGIQVAILWFFFPIRKPMKNRLWNTLKELKTKTTNEDGA